MANIKVVDVNEDASPEARELRDDKQEETPVVDEPPIIEEAKPEEEVVNEVVEEVPTNEETASGSLNSNKVGVETKEEQPKPKAKPKPSDIVDCNTCGKSMSYKNYRYRHEKLCTAEPKPVKAQAKPKAKVKMMPKPTFKTIEVEDASPEARELRDPQVIQQPEPKQVIKQQIQQQPSNPLSDITNHYQLLQQQFIQQKKEKYNNLCQNMFAPKSKKR